jgi:hypothetical protein
VEARRLLFGKQLVEVEKTVVIRALAKPIKKITRAAPIWKNQPMRHEDLVQTAFLQKKRRLSS